MEDTQGVTPAEGKGSEGASDGVQKQDATAQDVVTEQKPTPAQGADIDWSSISPDRIPDSLVRQHPAFQSVLDESVERRKKLKALEKAVPDQGGDVDKKFAQLDDKMNQLIKLETERSVNEQRRTLASAHNVPAERVKYISGDTYEDMEASAKELGNPKGVAGSVVGDASPGNPGGNVDPLTGIRSRLRDRREDKGLGSDSIFDPGAQRQLGGGPVKR